MCGEQGIGEVDELKGLHDESLVYVGPHLLFITAANYSLTGLFQQPMNKS